MFQRSFRKQKTGSHTQPSPRRPAFKSCLMQSVTSHFLILSKFVTLTKSFHFPKHNQGVFVPKFNQIWAIFPKPTWFYFCLKINKYHCCFVAKHRLTQHRAQAFVEEAFYGIRGETKEDPCKTHRAITKRLYVTS